MEKAKDWKQQFFDVQKIGPEPAMNREGFWKQYQPPKIKFQGEKDVERHDK